MLAREMGFYQIEAPRAGLAGSRIQEASRVEDCRLGQFEGADRLPTLVRSFLSWQPSLKPPGQPFSPSLDGPLLVTPPPTVGRCNLGSAVGGMEQGRVRNVGIQRVGATQPAVVQPAAGGI